MVNVGIIGVGYWGSNLVRAFNNIEDAAIAAVAERKPGRVHFVQKRYPHIRVTSDHHELLKDPTIDALIVATPVPTHFEVARDVLNAGKHVFIEKPMAYTVEEAETLRELANRLGLVLAVGHVYQFSPAVSWLTSNIQDAKLGKMFHIDSTRINLGPPKSEVDVIWDLAPHDVSIVLHLMRAAGLSTKVRKLQVMGNRFVSKEHIDLAHIFLEFECGMTSHIHVSWVASNKARLLQVSAEAGSIVFDDIQPVEKIKVYSEAVDNRIGSDDSQSVNLSYRPGDIFIPTLSRDEPLSLECNHFIDCVRNGSMPINGSDIGVEVVSLLEQITDAVGTNAFSESER